MSSFAIARGLECWSTSLMAPAQTPCTISMPFARSWSCSTLSLLKNLRSCCKSCHHLWSPLRLPQIQKEGNSEPSRLNGAHLFISYPMIQLRQILQQGDGGSHCSFTKPRPDMRPVNGQTESAGYLILSSFQEPGAKVVTKS